MWKDKPTGIKILWVWTIGTAAILLTCVSRTRMRDMETVLNAPPPPPPPPPPPSPPSPPPPQQGISTVDSVILGTSSDDKS